MSKKTRMLLSAILMLVAMGVASAAQAAPVQFLMQATHNRFSPAISPRPPFQAPDYFTKVGGLLPPNFTQPANKLTANLLVIQQTGVPQPTISVPVGALNNNNRGTSTRGMLLGLFATDLLQLTTRHRMAWPVPHPTVTANRGDPAPLTGTVTWMARPGNATTPSNFTWCPQLNLACTGAFDPGITSQDATNAAIKYTATAGKGRFGGTAGGLIRRPPFDGQGGGHLNVRAGTGLLQNPTSYQTVAPFSPITAKGFSFPQNVGLPLGETQMSLAPAGPFYSVNATLMGLITKRAPAPIMVLTPTNGTQLTTLLGAELGGSRWGAPHTTGMVTISVTANAAGKAESRMFTGTDLRTSGGLGTVVLVGGAITAGVQGQNNNWEIAVLTFSPEPATFAAAGAALLALAGGAVVARRRR